MICEDYSGGSDSADARHEDLRSSREHAHARPLAETGDPRELEGGGSCGVGEGRVEIPVDQAKGGRVTASEKKQKLQADGEALVDGVGAGGVVGNAAGVDGTGDDIGTGEVELQPDGTTRLDGTETGEVELQTVGAEFAHGVGTGEVDGKSAGVNGAGDGIRAGEVELQPDGTARLDDIGTDKVDGKAAVVDGAGSGEVPIVDFDLERIRVKAIAEAAARAVRDAVEVNRKTDLARARRAKESRWLADRQQKLEREASRDSKRREKLQRRESKENRKGERLRPPAEGTEGPVGVEREAVAEEGRGMSAQGGVQGCVPAAAVRTEALVDKVNGRRVTADEARATGAEKQKLRTDGHALSNGTVAGEVEKLRGGGIALLDGRGAGRGDHGAAVMDDSDSSAGGYPLVDANQEELQAKAVVEVAERVARDAVGATRKTDLTRDRRAERALRRAKRQEKVERKASRDSRRDTKRLKKLKDRESRARSQPGAAGRKETSEESR